MLAKPDAMPTLTLVGAGRLGRTLARLWAERQVFAIGQVFTRSPASAEAAVAFIGAGRASSLETPPGQVGLALLAVPDDQLETAARWLARQPGILPGAVVFHCSGAHSAEVLAPLRAAGARLASVHPMHSFADPARSLQTFAGTFCALEGEAPAVELIGDACAAIGGRPLAIRGEAKLLYHAGGVFASNYVTVLIDAALRLLGQAGIDAATGRQLLEPLLRGAVESALALGPGVALTGPVARGDTHLVQREARAVAAHEAGLGALYAVLAHAATDLATRQGRLDPQQAHELRTALERSSQDPSSMCTPTAQSISAKP